MTAPHTYITTTIPYVNARPHIGFALELVQADVLARHYRRTASAVRFQTGTDDNALKNVLAAKAAGVAVQDFVDRNAAAFTALAGTLSLSVDDTIRTSRDPRHRIGVHRLWQACAASGDLYRKHYEGLYCVGCEQFYTSAELTDDGRCREHGTRPELIEEENWFFRLSRYAGPLRRAVESGALRIEPVQRRNEVLAFIDGGLADFSVSRDALRARGWGIPVPGDPSQVIYVWWDALGNYLTALNYGDPDDSDLERWWTTAARRIHLIGKGVIRFHAVYWPAILLSAGEARPTDILVHDYLTTGGRKISKSGGADADPHALVARYGTDAVRWWLLREVPRSGDTDFTPERLVSRANDELANGIGNLVKRVVTTIHRYRDGYAPPAFPDSPDADSPHTDSPHAGALAAAIREADAEISGALAAYAFRPATEAVWRIAVEANRYIEHAKPWELARAERGGAASHDLDAVLGELLGACRAIGERLGPFLPDAAARITRQCEAEPDGRLPAAVSALPRIERLDLA
ncbi:MAG TPA: methionine--tRNA ligase [Trebonia sp.]